MAHPLKHISLLKSVLSNSAPYSLALSIIFLHPLGSVAVARGEVVEIKNLPVQKGVHSSIQTTSPKTPSPQKPPTPSKPSEPEVLVSEVVVSGVDGKLEDEAYKAIINTQPGRTTTRSKLQEDINAIFATGWFLNVQAVPKDTPLGVQVTFEVKPNPVLKVVQMQGSQILPPSVVHQIFSPQYGSILNLRQLQERIKQLHLWYRYKGYSQANVSAQSQVAADGTVTLGVVEGIVEAIQVRFVNDEGKDKDDRGKPILGHIPSSIIIQKFKLEPGKVFYKPQAVKDLQQIEDLGFFDNVNITLKKGKNPSQLIVLVNVDENELASHAQKILKYRQELRIFKATKNQLREAEVLQKLASIYSDAGEKQQAITKYEEALRIYQSKQDQLREAFLLNRIGNIYYNSTSDEENEENSKKFQLAITKYLEAIKIYKTKQDLAAEAKVLNNLGNTQKKSKQYQQSLDTYSQALSIFKTLNLPFWKALTLNNIAFTYRELNEKERALEFYNQALLVWRQIRKNSVDVKLQLEGKKVKLVSLPENREEGSLYFACSISSTKGTVCDAGIQVDKSLKKTVFSNIGFWESINLFNLADIYQSLGDYQQALYSSNDTLLLLQSLNYSELFELDEKWKKGTPSLVEAFYQLYTSLLYSDIGEKQLAQEYLNQVLAKLPDFWSQLTKESLKLDNTSFTNYFNNFFIKIISSFANNQKYDTEDYQKQVLSLMDEAIKNEVIKKSELQPVISWLKRSIQVSTAQEYVNSGKKKQAIDLYNQALSGLEGKSLIFQQQSKDNYNQLMSLLQPIKDGKQSTDLTFHKILPLFSFFEKQVFFDALKSKGEVLFDLNKKQQALYTYNQALSLSQALKNTRDQAEILCLIGKVYSADKRYQTALDFYNRALSLAEEAKDVFIKADTRLGIAILEQTRGNLTQARNEIEKAIESIESERAQIDYQQQQQQQRNNSSPPPPSKQTNYKSYVELAAYLESKQNYYDFYIDLLMQLHQQFPLEGYDIQALQASERSHARSLLAIINRASRNPQGTQTANSSNSNYLQLAKPPQIKEIQQQVLDDNTLLLEYALGEEHSYLWVVTKTTITSYELPKRAEIETAARLFYDFLTVPSQRIRTTKAAKAGANLSQMLLEPIVKQLGNKRLLVVADGVLQYIPFSALPTPNSQVIGAENSSTYAEPLLVNHEIINLPSASTLAVIRHSNKKRRSPTKTLAVLADPVFSREDERITLKPSESSLPFKQNLSNLVSSNGVQSHSQLTVEQLYPRLPGTRQEADQILSFVPQSEQLQKYGFAASRQAVFSSELSQYRLIHFATHGILDTQKPERSGILLSIVNEQNELQRGLLSTPDTFNLNLSADLVVLSGCRTGLGKQVKGEGLIGLTGGLMYSGAKRVMVSLWSVDDEATVELMTRFYQRVLKDKLPPAKALREAQLTMWRDKRWQNPYDWAAFTIQGEWN